MKFHVIYSALFRDRKTSTFVQLRGQDHVTPLRSLTFKYGAVPTIDINAIVFSDYEDALRCQKQIQINKRSTIRVETFNGTNLDMKYLINEINRRNRLFYDKNLVY